MQSKCQQRIPLFLVLCFIMTLTAGVLGGCGEKKEAIPQGTDYYTGPIKKREPPTTGKIQSKVQRGPKRGGGAGSDL